MSTNPSSRPEFRDSPMPTVYPRRQGKSPRTSPRTAFPDLSEEGIAAMKRLADGLRGDYSGPAVTTRRVLRSLLTGFRVDLSHVPKLDGNVRRDLGMVIATVGQPGFPEHLIREIFEAYGNSRSAWFFDGLPGVIDDTAVEDFSKL